MQSDRLLYRIQPASPEAHVFTVEVAIPPADRPQIKLSMPAWIPGSYMIRDFAKHVLSLVATCNGNPVRVEKLDKQTWLCRDVVGALQVSYEVYAWNLSVRGAHLDRTHAYFNGSCVYLAVDGMEDQACDVEILPPGGEEYRAWRVATTLERVGAREHAFGRYRAASYADLIDHPVEIGLFDLLSFSARGVRHEVAVTGRHQLDRERLRNDLQLICEEHGRVFGDLPPQAYLFLVTVVGEGYGGLEHRSCCSLLVRRDDLPQPGVIVVTEGYRRFLGLCSHEYFHLWNVKRIRPQAFLESGLEREVYTSLLWAFEGITSYYDNLALVRSGCIDPKSYLDLLAQDITALMRTPGRFKQSLAESSFDAWTKFYQQDDNAPNAIVSYYTKGALVALALDLTIRQRTNGAVSLDEVVRALWQHHGKTGIGVPEDGVEKLAQQVTGLDLSAFFERALRTTSELDIASLLRNLGVAMHLRPQRDGADKGGLVDEFTEFEVPLTLGIRLAPNQAAPTIAHVLADSAAQRTGLAPGDTLVAIGGIKTTRDNVRSLIERVPAGQAIEVHGFRRDELMTFEVIPLPAPADTCELCLISDASDAAIAARRAWLREPPTEER